MKFIIILLGALSPSLTLACEGEPLYPETVEIEIDIRP